MKANTKKKPSFFERKPALSKFLIVFGIIFGGFALLTLNIHPALQPVRDSWIFVFSAKAVMSGIVLGFTWRWSERLLDECPPLFEKIILSLFAVMPWADFFIGSYRLFLLINMILFYILMVVFVRHFATDKKYNYITGGVTVCLAMIIVFSVNDYTFLHNAGGIHFWQFALIAAVVITAALVVLAVKKVVYFQEDKISEKIACFFLTFGGVFLLFAFTAGNLNYSLDFSEPAEYPAVILERRIDAYGRGSMEYVFTANVNGEENEFHVSESEYYKKDEGDSFSVQLYGGAFGDEYYIYNYDN